MQAIKGTSIPEILAESSFFTPNSTIGYVKIFIKNLGKQEEG